MKYYLFNQENIIEYGEIISETKVRVNVDIFYNNNGESDITVFYKDCPFYDALQFFCKKEDVFNRSLCRFFSETSDKIFMLVSVEPISSCKSLAILFRTVSNASCSCIFLFN